MMKRIAVLVLIAILTLALGESALAAEFSFGGSCTFKYSNDLGPSWYSGYHQADQSAIGWLSLTMTSKKTFSPKGSAYFQLLLEPTWYTEEAGGPTVLEPDTEVWSINFGYTYNFSDSLSFTIMKDKAGVDLSKGLLTGDDWGEKVKLTAKYGNPIGASDKLRGSTGSNALLKLDAKPIEGLSLTVAVDPLPDEAVFGGPRYLLKGEYVGDGFKIGGGYGHGILEITGYPGGTAGYDIFDDYDLYAEVSPIEGLTVYAEYAMDYNQNEVAHLGQYLLKASYSWYPFTVNLMYANVDNDEAVKNPLNVYQADKIYKKKSIDLAVDYKLRDDLTLSGGLAYGPDALADVFAKAKYGPYTATVSYDYAGEAVSLYGAYKFDGTNSIEAGYNLKTGIYELMLYLSLW